MGTTLVFPSSTCLGLSVVLRPGPAGVRQDALRVVLLRLRDVDGERGDHRDHQTAPVQERFVRFDRMWGAAVIMKGEDWVHPGALQQTEGDESLLPHRLHDDRPGAGREAAATGASRCAGRK